MAMIFLIDIFCVVILGVLLIGIKLQKDAQKPLSEKFSLLVYSAIAFLAVSFFSDLLEGKEHLDAYLFVVNLLLFLAVDMVVFSFTGYLGALLNESDRQKSKELNVVIVASFVRMAVVIALAFTGNLFAIENGHYAERTFASIPYSISVVIMAMLLFIVIRNRKSFSKLQYIVIIIYVVLPTLFILLEMYSGIYMITNTSITLSILLIYVLIQTVEIKEGRMRENELEEMSQTDLMTATGNRRAYYSYVSEIEPEENVGIVFCDVNGLKYINDHFGHSEGDRLIKRFAGILISCYGSERTFRISGDEFVVIVKNISEKRFNDGVTAFEKAVSENGDIAAVGVAYGMGCSLERLISDAEDSMYKNKKESKASRESKKEVEEPV